MAPLGRTCRAWRANAATSPNATGARGPRGLGLGRRAALSSAKLLIADAARLDIAADGRQLKRETLHERFGLPKPDRLWRWDLAPIPEWSPAFHRVHEVGAWIFGQ